MGSGLAAGGPLGLKRLAFATPPRIRVAAVQMKAELAHVDANLLKAERLIRLAFKRGAR